MRNAALMPSLLGISRVFRSALLPCCHSCTHSKTS